MRTGAALVIGGTAGFAIGYHFGFGDGVARALRIAVKHVTLAPADEHQAGNGQYPVQESLGQA
jgi:hypothetical protein